MADLLELMERVVNEGASVPEALGRLVEALSTTEPEERARMRAAAARVLEAVGQEPAAHDNPLAFGLVEDSPQRYDEAASLTELCDIDTPLPDSLSGHSIAPRLDFTLVVAAYVWLTALAWAPLLAGAQRRRLAVELHWRGWNRLLSSGLLARVLRGEEQVAPELPTLDLDAEKRRVRALLRQLVAMGEEVEAGHCSWLQAWDQLWQLTHALPKGEGRVLETLMRESVHSAFAKTPSAKSFSADAEYVIEWQGEGRLGVFTPNPAERPLTGVRYTNVSAATILYAGYLERAKALDAAEKTTDGLARGRAFETLTAGGWEDTFRGSRMSTASPSLASSAEDDPIPALLEARSAYERLGTQAARLRAARVTFKIGLLERRRRGRRAFFEDAGVRFAALGSPWEEARSHYMVYRCAVGDGDVRTMIDRVGELQRVYPSIPAESIPQIGDEPPSPLDLERLTKLCALAFGSNADAAAARPFPVSREAFQFLADDEGRADEAGAFLSDVMEMLEPAQMHRSPALLVGLSRALPAVINAVPRPNASDAPAVRLLWCCLAMSAVWATLDCGRVGLSAGGLRGDLRVMWTAALSLLPTRKTLPTGISQHLRLRTIEEIWTQMQMRHSAFLAESDEEVWAAHTEQDAATPHNQANAVLNADPASAEALFTSAIQAGLHRPVHRDSLAASYVGRAQARMSLADGDRTGAPESLAGAVADARSAVFLTTAEATSFQRIGRLMVLARAQRRWPYSSAWWWTTCWTIANEVSAGGLSLAWSEPRLAKETVEELLIFARHMKDTDGAALLVDRASVDPWSVDPRQTVDASGPPLASGAAALIRSATDGEAGPTLRAVESLSRAAAHTEPLSNWVHPTRSRLRLENSLGRLSARGLFSRVANVAPPGSDVAMVHLVDAQDRAFVQVHVLGEDGPSEPVRLDDKWRQRLGAAVREIETTRAQSLGLLALAKVVGNAARTVGEALGRLAGGFVGRRVILVPTGIFRALPIHAARDSRAPIFAGAEAITCLPSVDLLVWLAERHARRSLPRDLVATIAHDRVGNLGSILDVTAEHVHELAGQHGVQANSIRPTRSAVLESANQHSLLLLAGHGHSDPEPLRSRLLLEDDLRVGDVLTEVHEAPTSVFIASCEAGWDSFDGGLGPRRPTLALDLAFLRTGARHVVAPMFEVPATYTLNAIRETIATRLSAGARWIPRLKIVEPGSADWRSLGAGSGESHAEAPDFSPFLRVLGLPW